MTNALRALLALCVLLLAAPAAHAQAAGDPPQRRVVLVDGTVIVGTVDDEGADPLVIRTASGVEQRVARAQVREVTGLLAGRFTRLDPARTRLYLAPTARTLGRGDGRFSAYYLFPSAAFGVSDRVDMSVGASVPAISSDGDFVMALNLNLKGQLVRFEGGAAAVGGSAIIPITSFDGFSAVAGTVYGVATLGSDVRAVTLGVFGLYGTDFEDASFADGALLLMGLESQVSNSVKLISENYLAVGYGGSAGVLTGGVRFFGDRLAADVAAALVVTEGGFQTIPIPYLGLSYTW